MSSGEERSISPDSVSGLLPEQRSSRVFSLSSLPSLAGAWYGAEASILVNTGLAESSGRGSQTPNPFHFLYPALKKDGSVSVLPLGI